MWSEAEGSMGSADGSDPGDSDCALLVLSAPSGTGKTTVARRLLQKFPELYLRSVSVTTRAPRPGEVDGKHYHFAGEKEFDRLVAENRFLEHAGVFGARYGTLRDALERARAERRVLVLTIDVQGARQLRERKEPGVYLFLLPPSREELERRLARRGTDSPEERERRLAAAVGEIQAAGEYDARVINDDLDRVTDEIDKLVRKRLGVQAREKAR